MWENGSIESGGYGGGMRRLLVGIVGLAGLAGLLWLLTQFMTGDALAIAGALAIVLLPPICLPVAFPEYFSFISEANGPEEIDDESLERLRLNLLPYVKPLSSASAVGAGLWIGMVSLNWMWVGLLSNVAFLFIVWLLPGPNPGSLRLSVLQVLSIIVGRMFRQLNS
jgi:hypothetical protein